MSQERSVRDARPARNTYPQLVHMVHKPAVRLLKLEANSSGKAVVPKKLREIDLPG
jgi:hypothetical protein